MKPDIYDRITNRIIADLEKGVRSWLKPWSASGGGAVSRPLRANGEAYSGINTLTLWGAAFDCGYAIPRWMTYRQALKLGGQVRKGERGAPVVYADRIVKTEEDARGGDFEKVIPFLKAYTVFNVAQIDGLAEDFYVAPAPVANAPRRIAAAEAFFAGTGAEITHGGDRAFYSVGADRVTMPPFEAFRDAESYYAVLGHECVHWTGHVSRLEREFGAGKRSKAYAREELVAELGAAFLCADLGLSLEPRPDHSAYLANWLEVLNEDNRAIFRAAAHAQRAVTFLHGLQGAEAQQDAA